ncbi:MAG: hypothetical protein LC776_08685 [Acidobacteria bacterium]|nr:hypothetical protein [Acidobacteriota bacterium]
MGTPSSGALCIPERALLGVDLSRLGLGTIWGHSPSGEDFLYVLKPGLTARTRRRDPLRAPGRRLPPALRAAGAWHGSPAVDIPKPPTVVKDQMQTLAAGQVSGMAERSNAAERGPPSRCPVDRPPQGLPRRVKGVSSRSIVRTDGRRPPLTRRGLGTE